MTSNVPTSSLTMCRSPSLSSLLGLATVAALAAACGAGEHAATARYVSVGGGSGHGMAGAGPDRAEVRGGHVHYIPKGVEHFMYNLSKTEPLEVIGIYIGAGNVEETGYAYTGEVTDADLRR